MLESWTGMGEAVAAAAWAWEGPATRPHHAREERTGVVQAESPTGSHVELRSQRDRFDPGRCPRVAATP